MTTFCPGVFWWCLACFNSQNGICRLVGKRCTKQKHYLHSCFPCCATWTAHTYKVTHVHIRLSSWKQLACFASNMKQTKHMVFAKHVFIHCILCQAFFFIYCMLKQCNDRSPMFSSVFFVVFDLQKVCFLQLGINQEKPKLVCLISFFNSLNFRAFRNVL